MTWRPGRAIVLCPAWTVVLPAQHDSPLYVYCVCGMYVWPWRGPASGMTARSPARKFLKEVVPHCIVALCIFLCILYMYYGRCGPASPSQPVLLQRLCVCGMWHIVWQLCDLGNVYYCPYIIVALPQPPVLPYYVTPACGMKFLYCMTPLCNVARTVTVFILLLPQQRIYYCGGPNVPCESIIIIIYYYDPY